MKSIVYKYPTLYRFFLTLNHGKKLQDIYQIVAKKIDKYKTVIDVGSGICLLKNHLHVTNQYFGIDLNENFVRYARSKGINAIKMNMFNFKKYPKADVYVICGTLHHIYPKHGLLIKKLKNKGKLIVCEGAKKNLLQENKVTYLVRKLLDKFLLDNDGINTFDNRNKWNLSKNDLKVFFQKLKAREIFFYKNFVFAIWN